MVSIYEHNITKGTEPVEFPLDVRGTFDEGYAFSLDWDPTAKWYDSIDELVADLKVRGDEADEYQYTLLPDSQDYL